MNALFLALSLLVADAGATTFTAPAPLPELAQDSRAVVLGVITDSHTRRTRDGLETQYVVSVDEAIVGHAADQLTVVLPGGNLDGLVQQVHGVPLWEEGDEVVVFLPWEGPLRMRGLFTLEGERLVDPLRRGPRVPETLWELEELLERQEP